MNDVVGAYVALAQSDVRSEIVNVCSGKAISLHAVLSMMNDLAGYEIEVVVNKEFVREHDIRQLAGDNSKLKRLIGFAPSTAFFDTLKRMYDAGLQQRTT